MFAFLAFSLVALIALAGAFVSAQSLRFERRVEREARALWSALPDAPKIARERIASLPPPVQRYLNKALGERERVVRSLRLRHGGSFRAKLDGAWSSIRGEHYMRADPPGFVWHGRIGVAPGLWIEGRDRSVDGVGNMLITIESTFTLADAKGPQLDQGALLRLLGELTWLPSAWLDERYLQWSPLDGRRAAATLRVGGHEVHGVFEFGPDDLPARFVADRYRDLGDGRQELTPFVGESADYREVDGVLVPHAMTGSWIVDGKPVPYARFLVEQIELDPQQPF